MVAFENEVFSIQRMKASFLTCERIEEKITFLIE